MKKDSFDISADHLNATSARKSYGAHTYVKKSFSFCCTKANSRINLHFLSDSHNPSDRVVHNYSLRVHIECSDAATVLRCGFVT